MAELGDDERAGLADGEGDTATAGGVVIDHERIPRLGRLYRRPSPRAADVVWLIVNLEEASGTWTIERRAITEMRSLRHN